MCRWWSLMGFEFSSKRSFDAIKNGWSARWYFFFDCQQRTPQISGEKKKEREQQHRSSSKHQTVERKQRSPDISNWSKKIFCLARNEITVQWAFLLNLFRCSIISLLLLLLLLRVDFFNHRHRHIIIATTTSTTTTKNHLIQQVDDGIVNTVIAIAAATK